MKKYIWVPVAFAAFFTALGILIMFVFLHVSGIAQ